jgi:large subunit ribosomal protein L18
LIDDSRGHTLASISTVSAEYRGKEKTPGKVEAAKWVGTMIADKALAQKITKVVFDRNGFLYHGRLRALADAARGKGLDF